MKEGWEYKKLGDIATYINGFPFKPSDWEDSGKPIIRIQNLTNPQSTFNRCSRTDIPKKYFVSYGDILISWSATLGVFEWTLEDALLNQHIFKVVFDKIAINKQYFRYAIMTSISEMSKHTNGATMKHIRKGDFDNIRIPSPPLSEQQYIVDYLDSAFAKIDVMKANAEKALNDAKALFQASLKEMLEPKEGWEEKTLKEIGCTQTGTTPSKGDKDNYGDFMPFIRPSEIDYDGSGRIEYNSALKLSKKGANNGRVFDAGSIFMVCIGATIGKVGYGERTISCNQQINIFTPNNSINYKYAYYAMKDDGFQHKVIKEGTSSQATLPIINKGKWEKLSISYPSLSEQQSIVATLDSLKSKVDRLQENYDKISQECDALKQAILRQVFE